MQSLLLTCVFVELFFICSIASGQASTGKSLSRCLDHFAEKRNEIKTFSAKMRGVQYLRDSKSSVPGLVVNSVTSCNVEIVGDLIQDQFVIISERHALFPGLSAVPADTGSAFSVYTVQGNRARILGVDNKFIDVRHLKEIRVPNPLALGIGFCYESSRFFRFSEVVSPVYAWPGMKAKHRGTQTTFYDRWLEDIRSYQTAITFDSSRGDIVTEVVHASGRSEGKFIRGEVEPVQIGSHWLPKRVAYSCGPGGLFFTWDIEWLNVNEPVPSDLFDEATLLKLLGVSP